MSNASAAAAADAASRLISLWAQPAHAALLQQPPPAVINAELQTFLERSYSEIITLKMVMHRELQICSGGREVYIGAFLEGLLEARAVATLAQLLAWLQQRPELLHIAEVAAERPPPGDHTTYTLIWITSSRGAQGWQRQRRQQKAVTVACQAFDSEVPIRVQAH